MKLYTVTDCRPVASSGIKRKLTGQEFWGGSRGFRRTLPPIRLQVRKFPKTYSSKGRLRADTRWEARTLTNKHWIITAVLRRNTPHFSLTHETRWSIFSATVREARRNIAFTRDEACWCLVINSVFTSLADWNEKTKATTDYSAIYDVDQYDGESRLTGRDAIMCSTSWHQATLTTERLVASCPLLLSLGTKRFQADSSICSRRLFS
jgi:hypothetical protein